MLSTGELQMPPSYKPPYKVGPYIQQVLEIHKRHSKVNRRKVDHGGGVTISHTHIFKYVFTLYYVHAGFMTALTLQLQE